MQNKIDRVRLYRKYNSNTISWEEALNNLNDSVMSNELYVNNRLGFYISYSANKLEKVKIVMKSLKCDTAHLYVNVTVRSDGLGNHKDSMDVYFWQSLGQSKWVIEEKEEFVLNAGDLIFVPKEVFHHVTPLSPRVGISMAKEF